EVQEQAFRQILPPLLLSHLIDDLLDLAHGVFEGPLELAFGGDLAVQRLQHGQQIAVERHLDAGRQFDRAHGYAPTLLTALGSSGCTSMKFCAPVIVNIVSTRFWTPASFKPPAAALGCP